MYPHTTYEMSEADLAAILDACKPVPYMIVGGRAPSSQQENANRAWAELGEKMGFDPMTVRPGAGGNQRVFTAIPSETEDQRAARIAREADEAKATEIARLTTEIEERQQRLAALHSTAAA